MIYTVSKSFLKEYWNKHLAERKEIERTRFVKSLKGEKRGGKYIFRKETGKPDRPYIYIYLKDFLSKPFDCLSSVFGIKQKEIDETFDKEKIEKKYGVDRKGFAQHVLEYFSHRDIWDKRFAKKELAEKYKKPRKVNDKTETEDKEVATPEAKESQLNLFAEYKPKEKKWRANPSLMRKIWSMYTGKTEEKETKAKGLVQKVLEKITKVPDIKESEAEKHKNRSEAMKGNDNAKKINADDLQGVNDDNTKLEQAGIPERNSDIRDTSGQDSSTDVSESEYGNYRDELLQRTIESGERPRDAEIDSSGDGRGDGRNGRLSVSEAKKIRTACKELLAKKTDSEMTEDDKLLLSQYVGAGGLDEKDSSNSGVLYEFYTPRVIVNKVWQLLDKYMPNQNKTCIEPSSGIGRFAEGRKEKFTFFEYENDSARIAKILHPDAEVHEGAFEKNFMKQYNGMFSNKSHALYDCAVGNPPYGDYTGLYKGQGEGKEYKTYPGYFMSKTLDTLKDGGVMAMVVPSGFLDNNNRFNKDRGKIAEKGELLEAWRLPNNSFDSTAIGTDIILIRKGKGNKESFEKYFEKNPEHIAGIKSQKMGRFGMEDYIAFKPGEDMITAIDNINVNAVTAKKYIPETETKIAAKPEIKNIIPDNLKIFDEIETVNGKGKITGYIYGNGKNVIGYSVRYPNVDEADNVYFTEQKTKPKKSEAEKHLNRSNAMKGNKNAEGQHVFTPSIGKCMTADEFNTKYSKAFTKDDLDIWKKTEYTGKINISQLTDKEKDYVRKSENYIKDGEGYYISSVNYASGNIAEKLKALDKNDEEYEKKKALLESVLPPKKKIGEFTINPISDWAINYKIDDESLVDKFLEWAVGDKNSSWLSDSSPVTTEEIPPEISWSDVLDYIRKKPAKAESVKRYANRYQKTKWLTDENWKEYYPECKSYYEASEKLEAKLVQEEKDLAQKQKNRVIEIRADTAIKIFNRFLRDGLTDKEQKDLTEKWNEQFNSTINPDYKKIPVFIEGMNTHKGTKEFTLTEQQIKGVSFLTNKGAGVLAYDVGVGKTATGICATVAQVQSGRAKRPVIIVPNSVYKQWIGEIRQLFPNVKLNELGNLSKKGGFQNIKIEDGSISIITDSALKNIKFKEESMAEIKQDIEFAMLEESSEKASKRNAAKKDEKNNEILGRATKTKDADAVFFEDLGFDHITIDEAHNYKNIFAQVKKVKLEAKDKQEANEYAALGGGKPSDRGLKMFAMTQLVQKKNHGRNVFGLTATPFTNSPIEIYSMLSLFARERLKEMGIDSLEEFTKQYADLRMEYTVTANQIKEKQVMKSFHNLKALQNLIAEYFDKVDGDEAHVIRPYCRRHYPEMEMTPLQKQIMAAESAYLEEQATLPKDERDPAATLSSMNYMKSCAISPVLIPDERYEKYRELGFNIKKPSDNDFVETSPKLKFTCDSIIQSYKANKKEGQVMYLPLGVSYFGKIKEYLVKNGVPADAIATFEGGKTSEKELEKKDATVQDFNDENGKTKIIIGSQTISEGMNLNGNSTTLYNCQLGWNSTETTQVEGRIWRQGNKQGIVHIVYPLLHDSMDSVIYQKHDEKQSRINSIWSYKGDTMVTDAVDPNEIKFQLIKDPKKRASLMVMEYKEKANSDKLIYKQKKSLIEKRLEALKTAKDVPDNPYSYNKQSLYEVYEENKKNVQTAKKELVDIKERFNKEKDTYKGKYPIQRYTNGKYEDVIGEQAYKHDVEKLEDIYNKNYADMTKRAARIKQHEKMLESVKKQLLAEGIKDEKSAKQILDALDEKIKLSDEAIAKAGEQEETFYQQAVEYNKKQEKNLPTLEALVKQNVNSIRGDLHVMDDAWKEQIKKENEERFKKSLIIRNGRVWVNKSILINNKYMSVKSID